MPYDTSADYANYEAQDDCGCGCPVGTVAVYNSNGEKLGCLSPNDAALYYAETHACSDGFMKLLDANGKFNSCVAVADYATAKAAL